MILIYIGFGLMTFAAVTATIRNSKLIKENQDLLETLGKRLPFLKQPLPHSESVPSATLNSSSFPTRRHSWRSAPNRFLTSPSTVKD